MLTRGRNVSHIELTEYFSFKFIEFEIFITARPTDAQTMQ